MTWPLSAPATALLVGRGSALQGELVRLAVRQLVLSGCWRLEADPLPPKRFGRTRVRPPVRLVPLPVPPPPALARFDACLRVGSPAGGTALLVLKAARDLDHDVLRHVRDDARDELRRGGLWARQRNRLGLSFERLTPLGEQWRAAVPATHAAWRQDLQGGAAAAAVAAALAAPGLLLAGDADLLSDLDRELKRSDPGVSGDGAGPVEYGGGGGDLGLDGVLDGLLDGLRGLGDLDFGIGDGGGDSGDGGGD